MLNAIGNIGICIAHDCCDTTLSPLSHSLHASDHLALKALLVEKPFARNDELGIGDTIVEIEFVGNQFEAGQQASAKSHQRTSESARCAAASDGAHIGAVVAFVHLSQAFEATREHVHLRWRCTLLRRKDFGRSNKRCGHIAGHQ